MILHQSFAKSMTKKSETNMKVILRFRRFRRFQSSHCNSEAVCLSFKKNYVSTYYFKSSFCTHLLLHWEDAIVVPSILTSGNGEPDAKIALPKI